MEQKNNMKNNSQDSKFKTPAPSSKAVSGNLADVFAKRLEQLGLKRQVDAALVCEAFDSAVFEAFGEAGKKNVRAISFKDNTLKVAVTSSSWANEISLRQIELLAGETMRIVYQVSSQEDSL